MRRRRGRKAGPVCQAICLRAATLAPFRCCVNGRPADQPHDATCWSACTADDQHVRRTIAYTLLPFMCAMKNQILTDHVTS